MRSTQANSGRLEVENATLSLRPTVRSSLAMTLGGMADAFLYAYLPLNATTLELNAFSVGAILSINKFVRVLSNRWVNALAAVTGLKHIVSMAICLAALTSMSYAFEMPLWFWLLVRVVWGISYSMFRFASVQYVQVAPHKGEALGIATSIKELGPVLAYWFGPIVLTTWGASPVFLTSAVATLMGMALLHNLPNPKAKVVLKEVVRFQKPNWLDAWVFISSFLIDGFVVVTVSILLRSHANFWSEHVLMNTAIFISMRRVFQIILAPLTGSAIRRYGHRLVFALSSVLICVALGFMAGGIIVEALVIVFAAAAVNNVCMPLFALQRSSTRENYNAFAKLSTAKDIGAAVGALIGLPLVGVVEPRWIFSVLCVGSTYTLYRVLRR
ncbi:MFS transporter [Roseivirga sp. UBA1976]|uniref:MFS transporter n=1 Tax=Roseivirga sp. UBA1976 TaxID=1947386 RepID=UPI00257DE6AA|nr:MFS transporter [Roseivirga sp. UBA1976]|tara:strand:- start:94 stop:1248 length:1155 start_codon:yes stop_codon:yes gene_type:complete